MSWWVAVLAFVVGSWFGMLLMAMLAAAKGADRHIEGD